MIGWVDLRDGVLDVQKLPPLLVDSCKFVRRLDIPMVGGKNLIRSNIYNDENFLEKELKRLDHK